MQNKCRKEVVTITRIIYNKNDTKRKRKIIRIQGYDYSKEGLYFITICTEGRKEILSKINTETKYYIHRQNRDNNVWSSAPTILYILAYYYFHSVISSFSIYFF